jgi:PqqD family protein of HPr-rel-A system
MVPSPQVRWRAVSADVLAWHDWDCEVVVFNQATGSTHLLGELGGEIFRRLVAAKEGATVEALAAGLTDDPTDANDADWSAAVAGVLSDFARLGLAEPDAS